MQYTKGMEVLLTAVKRVNIQTMEVKQLQEDDSKQVNSTVQTSAAQFKYMTALGCSRLERQSEPSAVLNYTNMEFNKNMLLHDIWEICF